MVIKPGVKGKITKHESNGIRQYYNHARENDDSQSKSFTETL